METKKFFLVVFLALFSCALEAQKSHNCSVWDFEEFSVGNNEFIKVYWTGEIKHGKRADLILFDIEAGKMVIHKTIVAGKMVYCN